MNFSLLIVWPATPELSGFTCIFTAGTGLLQFSFIFIACEYPEYFTLTQRFHMPYSKGSVLSKAYFEIDNNLRGPRNLKRKA